MNVMELEFLPSHTNMIKCAYLVHTFLTVTHFIGNWNALDSGMKENNYNEHNSNKPLMPIGGHYFRGQIAMAIICIVS